MPNMNEGGGSICWSEHGHVVAAQWQLLQALRLYEQGEDLYSVITLAGAAEEIFGKLSRKMEHGCALDRLKDTIPKLSARLLGQELRPRDVADSVNKAKNWLKHGEGPLSFDARFEARDMLDRAIQNCWPLVASAMDENWDELTSPLLDAIARYDNPETP